MPVSQMPSVWRLIFWFNLSPRSDLPFGTTLPRQLRKDPRFSLMIRLYLSSCFPDLESILSEHPGLRVFARTEQMRMRTACVPILLGKEVQVLTDGSLASQIHLHRDTRQQSQEVHSILHESLGHEAPLHDEDQGNGRTGRLVKIEGFQADP